MAYEDAWRVCHPDFKRPFSSLEDACERLLPYHVVADYEAEEDDRLLGSSRCQQWDHNIANKLAEFSATFEKQVSAFNIITQRRGGGEFRSEERLFYERLILQEERCALFEARNKVGVGDMRMAHAEMMGRGRASAMGAHEQEPDKMMNRWENQDEKEAFLNDEERGVQSDWHEGGRFDA